MDCPDDMVCCGAKVCCVLKHGHECFAIRADEDNSKCLHDIWSCHGGCRACPFECDQNAQKTLDDFRDKLKAGHDIQEEQPTQESPSAPHREYFDWIIAVVFWLAILTPSCFIIFFTAKIILFSKRRNVFLEEMEVKSKNIIRLYASTNILVFMGIVYACIIVISIIGCWLSFQDMVNYVEREGVLNYPTVVVVLYFAMIFLMFDIFKTSYDTYKASRRNRWPASQNTLESSSKNTKSLGFPNRNFTLWKKSQRSAQTALQTKRLTAISGDSRFKITL